MLLGNVSENEMLIPLEEDCWSVKDHVAHVVIWEKRLIEWLNVVERGEVPRQLPPGMTWDDLDRWNEQTFEENSGRELKEVLADFNHFADEVVQVVEAIPEDLLMASGFSRVAFRIAALGDGGSEYILALPRASRDYQELARNKNIQRVMVPHLQEMRSGRARPFVSFPPWL